MKTNENVEEFGARLKSALKRKNMSQSKLSEISGINTSTISEYISGRYEPSRSRIAEFANVLDVNEVWLMGYDVPMERFQIRPDFVLPNGELIDIKYSRKLNKFEFYIRNPENPSSLKKLHLDDEHNQKLKDWISLLEISLKHIQIGPKTLVYLEKLIADIFIINYVPNEENV